MAEIGDCKSFAHYLELIWGRPEPDTRRLEKAAQANRVNPVQQ